MRSAELRPSMHIHVFEIQIGPGLPTSSLVTHGKQSMIRKDKISYFLRNISRP